jgi:hypothetical protein
MPVVLAGALLVVVMCSGARLVRPSTHGHSAVGFPLDFEVWHGLMGTAMAVMLLAGLSEGQSRMVMVVFGGGVVWCAVRLVGRASRAAYLRLGACCAAMFAMLVPASTTGPSSDGPMSGMAGMAGMADMRGMPGMNAGTLSPVIVVVLLVAMAGVIGAGLSRLALPGGTSQGPVLMRRMQATGEMVMAGAMAYMLVGLV